MKNMNTVTVKLCTYPEETGFPRTEQPIVEVVSHWNFKDRVALKVGQVSVTVLASDLKAAVDAATTH